MLLKRKSGCIFKKFRQCLICCSLSTFLIRAEVRRPVPSVGIQRFSGGSEDGVWQRWAFAASQLHSRILSARPHTAPAGLTSRAFIWPTRDATNIFWGGVNKKLTFVRDYCPSGNVDLILTRCCCHAGLLPHGHARRSQGDKTPLPPLGKKKVFCHAADLVRMSLSCSSAVWILTARQKKRGPQRWAKVPDRLPCGRSSVTECHSDSQHCDVRTACTSRPRPLWKAGPAECQSEGNRPGGW